MRFSVLAVALFAQAAFATPLLRRGTPTPKDIAHLAPELGGQPGINPDGHGGCDGPNGKTPRVPCSCPPRRDAYIRALTANVLAGHVINNPKLPVSFPTGNGVGDKRARISAAMVTLQNMNGPGVGCPIASTTLAAQAKVLHRRSSRLSRRVVS
jgi:hypothetical protein